MKEVGIVYLITESPEARGVLDAVTETRRKTYCEKKSLVMSEAYQARADGFNPVFKLVLPHSFEYRGETLCEYKGTRYKIIREYNDDKTDGTEITLERVRGNAARPATAEETAVPADPADPEETDETEGAEDV